jgi:hypothetical protein
MDAFKVGDTVRLRKTGEIVKIIGKGSLAIPRPDNTIWNVQPVKGGPSVNVLPEEIQPLDYVQTHN